MSDRDLTEALLKDAEESWPAGWPALRPVLDRCCFAISADVVMGQLGLFRRQGEFETYASICARTKIFEEAEYVFRRMLDILVEEEVLEQRDGGWSCRNPVPEIESATEALVVATREHPTEGAAFQMLARAYGGLSSFIRGQVSGEEILFPWSEFSLVEEFYRTSEAYRFWSALAGRAVKRIAEERFPGKKLVVLEVGAGTGHGTINVLGALARPEHVLERYLFTDVSKQLVKQGAAKFGAHPFMEFRPLDIGGDLEAQGFAAEGADVVVAVNVLHATDDLARSCRAVAKLLKKGGFAVIGEVAPPRGRSYRFMELTFGLLGSFYRYDDRELRPDGPLLQPEQWVSVFSRNDFAWAAAVPHDRMEKCDIGGVIVAQR
jgi:SAM-dependent methyltransferase